MAQIHGSIFNVAGIYGFFFQLPTELRNQVNSGVEYLRHAKQNIHENIWKKPLHVKAGIACLAVIAAYAATKFVGVLFSLAFWALLVAASCKAIHSICNEAPQATRPAA